jgi:hypothetical protein
MRWNRNHWIGFHTEGRRSNRSGLGARLRVTAADLTVTESVRSGSSYLSASQRAPVVGLGGRERVDVVEVEWPSGRKDRFTDLTADRYYALREGETLARPVDSGSGAVRSGQGS